MWIGRRSEADEPQIKHNVKAKFTMQSTGNAGGEGPRTHIQGMSSLPSHFFHPLTLTTHYSPRKLPPRHSSHPPACALPLHKLHSMPPFLQQHLIPLLPPPRRHHCLLCRRSSRYVQFRTRDPVAFTSAPSYLIVSTTRPTRHKRWCYACWAACRFTG